MIDPYAFGHPSSYTTRLNERYSFYKRQNSPLFDHELQPSEDIDKINQSSRFGYSDLFNFNVELDSYRPREGLTLDEKLPCINYIGPCLRNIAPRDSCIGSIWQWPLLGFVIRGLEAKSKSNESCDLQG